MLESAILSHFQDTEISIKVFLGTFFILDYAEQFTDAVKDNKYSGDMLKKRHSVSFIFETDGYIFLYIIRTDLETFLLSLVAGEATDCFLSPPSAWICLYKQL